uniref:Uncharacterized protein n=1 Tax=Kalanchoe fedtschenkoi TaxID=63787 RepID=A0A7N0UCZ3_KALFE
MESSVTHETDLNLEGTELRLGLPGRERDPVQDLSLCLRVNKRASHEMLSSSEESKVDSSTALDAENSRREASPPSK